MKISKRSKITSSYQKAKKLKEGYIMKRIIKIQ